MAEYVSVTSVPDNQTERYEKIKNLFIKEYGKEPVFFARAPGRVNLIGEHIDYCGYSVLPMAIEQDVVIAASPSVENVIRMTNTNLAYNKFECSSSDFEIDRVSPQWFHYVLCGHRGITDHFNLTEPAGVVIMVDGTVPPSAGLSSSSALVCCSSIVTMHSNKKQISRSELAEICQHCEHHIGTEGGGMDQAISFLAEEGKAKHIEFNPLKATDVQLPADVVFVISNSCVEMNKAATDHFNVRVAECRLACQIIAKKNCIDWRGVKRLGQLQTQLGKTLDDMLNLVEGLLHPEPYTKQEVCDLLEVTAEELDDLSLSARSRGVQSFKLYDRAKHVYGEAKRVLQFKTVCNDSPPQAAEQLGQLMNDSHYSCSVLYECSCDDLDELCAISRQSGALGSRLTGAGWGGCAVSLVRTSDLDNFLSQVKAKYYDLKPHRSDKVTTSLFATYPGKGAAIYSLEI